MLASSIPVKFPIPFGNNAGSSYIHQVPTASQIGITPGAASLTDGFVPLNFQNEATGGVPPFGNDFNGILNQITAWSRWQNAAGPVAYDGTFSTAIGGYPKGAFLTTAAGGGWWLSLVDNNTSNPDTGGANWQLIQTGTIYAGNPNGNVAGVAVSATGLSQALLWDTTNKLLWICTTSGNAASAVWTQLTGSTGGNVWCGTSGGTANAAVLTPPTTLQTLAAGTSFTWTVGVTNTSSATLQIGSFGTFQIKKGGPSGAAALVGGEMTATDLVTGFYDGTSIILTNIAFGTAAQANASSATGTVAAVSGGISVGHLAIFSDTYGTIVDGGVPGVAPAPTYLNASANGTTLGGGVYIVDTNDAGAFSCLLPASPTKGLCLDISDIAGTWAIAYFTLSRNGHTIMGSATDLICNRSGEKFRIWWNGSDWRLE